MKSRRGILTRQNEDRFLEAFWADCEFVRKSGRELGSIVEPKPDVVFEDVVVNRKG